MNGAINTKAPVEASDEGQKGVPVSTTIFRPRRPGVKLTTRQQAILDAAREEILRAGHRIRHLRLPRPRPAQLAQWPDGETA